MEIIRKFEKISKNDVGLAGGKGASLGEMISAGIPVPEGFVILAEVFDEFIKKDDLNVEIDAVLDEVDAEDVNSVEEASEKIQGMIVNSKMPEDIGKEIVKEFDELDAKFVAVRSSATSEDSATAAWAGQLNTYLNTTNKDLLDNVKKCWASLFTPRAIVYRYEKNLHQEKVSVAVVVQKMIESEISGIAFSVHPVTQDRNHIIIEAGLGLGEAIVSGQVTPDSYVVDKQDWHMIDINISEQTKALYRAENMDNISDDSIENFEKKSKFSKKNFDEISSGNVNDSKFSEGNNEWKELSSEESRKQFLNEKEIVDLGKLIKKIEDHYGFPVDVEWAVEGGKFYITQSRPITTLTGIEAVEGGEGDESVSGLDRSDAGEDSGDVKKNVV